MVRKIVEKGQILLRDPLLNRGTGFTLEEREEYKLFGFLPPHVENIEEQVLRAYEAYQQKPTDLERHIYLRTVQDRNETLFYRLVLDHLKEMMPIIYTPVVGEACQLFHRIYRQPRGLTLSYPEKDKMESVLTEAAFNKKIKVIVVTDGERILGLGDQGAGGLGIPIGKLSLYTACGGIAPEFTLPIILDVGTNNEERLKDPEYLGWRHHRITGKDYEDFVDQFVQTVKRVFPKVLLQFEDFAQQHAYPLLKKYHDQLCCFNDDIQGTAAVSVAAIIAATKVAKIQLKNQKIAVLGAGSAGCGISQQLVNAMVNDGLTKAEAYSKFYLVDRNGLLLDNMSDTLPFQQAFVRSHNDVSNWKLESTQMISLADVITNAKPSILLGVSGQPNQFTESIVRNMASYSPKPIIFPLSNPTSRVEATPKDILTWTEGRALVATGSPFDPVNINGKTYSISQCNNSYIFPGVGLGVIAGKAKRVSNRMMMAAAIALSDLSPAVETGEGALLPDLVTIRDVSKHIAKAVIKEGIKEKHISRKSNAQIEAIINKNMWFPDYENKFKE